MRLISQLSKRSLFFSAASMGANFVFPIVAVPFLNRSLGSEAFGSFAVAQALALIAAQFVDYGFSLGGSRSAAVAELAGHSPSQIYSNIQNSRVLLALGALILVSLTIYGIEFPVDKPVLFATAIPAVVGSFLQPVWFFQGRGLFRWLAISNTISKGLFLAGSIFLIQGPGDLQLLAAMYGGTFVLGGLLLQFGLRWEGIVWTANFIAKESLPPLRENFPSFVALLLLSGHTQFIIVAIGFLSGLPSSGALVAADRLVRGLAGLTSPLVSTAFPQLSRLSVSSPSEARRMRWHILGALFAWGVLCSAALYYFAHQLALKWYPIDPEYFTQVLYIVAPIPMLAGFGVAFGGLGLIVEGKILYYLLAIFVAELIGVTALWVASWFSPGICGAIGVIVTELMLGVMMAWAYFRSTKSYAK